MIVPFVALVLLLVLVPAFGDRLWVMGAVSAILAAALMMMAIALPVTRLGRFMRLLRPVREVLNLGHARD